MYEDKICDAVEVLERTGFHKKLIQDLREAKTPYEQVLALEVFGQTASGAGNTTPKYLHETCSQPCKYGEVAPSPLVVLEVLRATGLIETLLAQANVRFGGQNGVVVVTMGDRFVATVPAEKWKAALNAQVGSKVKVTTTPDGSITITVPRGATADEIAAAVPPHVHLHRWAGSKMRIIEPLLEALTNGGKAEVGAAVIPFWGSGVDGRALSQLGYTVYGSDLCADLIEAHRAATYDPERLIEELRPYVGKDAQTYYHVRAGLSSLSTAARFLYLVGSSFNGLWRTNKKGQHNVPYGRPFVMDEEAIRIAGMSARWQPHLAVCDWRTSLATARSLVAGSRLGAAGVDGFVQIPVLVYADPPYWGTFSGYGGGGFTQADHVDLAAALVELASRGARVVASNRDCAEVRKLYAAAAETAKVRVEFREVSARRSIAAAGDRRGAAGELIIVLTTVTDRVTI